MQKINENFLKIHLKKLAFTTENFSQSEAFHERLNT